MRRGLPEVVCAGASGRLRLVAGEEAVRAVRDVDGDLFVEFPQRQGAGHPNSSPPSRRLGVGLPVRYEPQQRKRLTKLQGASTTVSSSSSCSARMWDIWVHLLYGVLESGLPVRHGPQQTKRLMKLTGASARISSSSSCSARMSVIRIHLLSAPVGTLVPGCGPAGGHP